MPATRITDQQVLLYMRYRKIHSQELAAAKAGISVRSARRIERNPILPSQRSRRYWRSRADPFAEVWETEIRPLLQAQPSLMAITLLKKLQDDHPGQFPDRLLRTLQRRVRWWRALAGPPKEVFFTQTHAPGVMGLSDFTDTKALGVTIARVSFAPLLYHFVLAFSHWEYAEVVDGGESFEALARGLQNALWQAGGVPREHRSDSLSAAFKNLREQTDFTARYEGLLAHYGMAGTRNNRGQGHENGAVESAHRHLKEALDQALLLRGHRDFDRRQDYEQFVRDVVLRRNRRNAQAFRLERAALLDLPARRSHDFVEEEARVTRCGTFTVRGILYSAPSRLIGHRLKVRLYSERLECYLGGAPVLTLARGTRTLSGGRGQALDYRHFIEALKRKPQALAGFVFRDALFPREAYRRTWHALIEQLPQRQACQRMVGLLELAAQEGIEALLAERLEQLLAAGELPELERLRAAFAPRAIALPSIRVSLPQASAYDALLLGSRA